MIQCTCYYFLVAGKEMLSNGLEVIMAAEVGLLSRNIRIIGSEYNKLFIDSFGARVLVGTYGLGDAIQQGGNMMLLIASIICIHLNVVET